MDDDQNKEWTVWATVKLSGAWMTVSAKTKEEAKEIAENIPDFDTSGAEMTDWTITGIQED